MDILAIFVMLNNYFHDLATAVAIIASYVMMSLIKYVQQSSREESKEFLRTVYPKAVHFTGGIVILLLMAGIVRAFTYQWFEWDTVVGDNQVWLLVGKHIVMFSIFGYGVYLWIKMYKMVKMMGDK